MSAKATKVKAAGSTRSETATRRSRKGVQAPIRDGVQLRAALADLPAEEVSAPPVPAVRLVGEGQALALVAFKYRKELLSVGLDPILLDELAPRATLLSECQAALTVARESPKTLVEVKAEREAQHLRAELVADCRYLLRKDEQAQATVDRIMEGDGLDDLVQDLRNLVALCKLHLPVMKAALGRMAERLKRATDLANRIEISLARRRTKGDAELAALDLRNRAATLLMAAMTEVRDAGRYVFRGDPTKLAQFLSEYRRHHRTDPASSAEDAQADNAAGPADSAARSQS